MAEARRLGLRNRAIIFVGNTAEAARWTGDWTWALDELATFLESDLDAADWAWLFSSALVLRAWRGEAIAEQLATFETALKATRTSNMAVEQMRYDLESCRALGDGRLRAVRTTAHEYARISPLNAPAAYPLAAHAALWLRDLAAAAEDLAALEATGVRGPFTMLRRSAFRAGIAALEGRDSAARSLYAEARRGLLDRGIVFEAALVAIDMATLLGPDDPDAVAAAADARPALGRLSARPFLARLDATLAGTSESAPRV